ncbi:MAG: DKNYY domain-containing protein [Vulcanimicrobiota bacterium]
MKSIRCGCLLGALILGGCAKEGYSVHSGRVTWGQRQPKGYVQEQVVTGAVPAAFEILGKNHGRDNNHVFFQTKELKGCDPASAQLLAEKNFYLRDKSQVFAGDLPISDDPDHFELLSRGWSRDSRRVFFLAQPLPQSDPATFEPLPDSPYAGKDASHVYWRSQLLPDTEPQGYQVLQGLYSKGRNHAFFDGILLEGADGSSFITPTERFGHDQHRVYYNGVWVKQADARSAQFPGGDYLKDKNSVFFGAKQIPEADPSSFETFQENGLCGRDKSHVFHGASMVRDGGR